MATRNFAANKDNTSRSDGTGAGSIHTSRTGKWGSLIYRSFIEFTTDWSNVAPGWTARLVLTVSDNFGSTSAHPRVVVRLAREEWSEGSGTSFTSGSNRYDTDVFTSPVKAYEYPVGQGPAVDTQLAFDITPIVRYWAPASAGGVQSPANHGIRIEGTSDSNERFEFYSAEEANVAFRPYIELTYSPKATVPDTPVASSPAGDVASVDAFEADFSDSGRPTDTLARSEVQVYLPGTLKSGTASASTDRITSTAHGLTAGQEVWIFSGTGGAGLSVNTRYYVRTRVDANNFTLTTAPGGPLVNITTNYSALTFRAPFYVQNKDATETERIAAHSFVLPTGFHPDKEIVYSWRIRQKDSESQMSAWSALVDFTVTNTDPNAPTGLTPDADGIPAADDFDSLYGTIFRAEFSDDDDGDYLAAWQVQLATYSNPLDAGWDGALPWDTGKVYAGEVDLTQSAQAYGGPGLAAGTYYWRVRHWDQHGGLSDWSDLARIVVTTNFNTEPGTQPQVQVDSKAPWRIRIMEMKFNSIASVTGAVTGNATTNVFTTVKAHSLTVGRKIRFSSLTGGTGLFTDRTYKVKTVPTNKTFTIYDATDDTQATVDFTSTLTAATITAVTTRGPGNVIAIIENAKSVGASIVYNSPGEAHFTLPIDHPQVSVIEPKQVHYGIDMYTGDGWRETFAGLVWDLDATERDAVFPCLDYLALYDTIYDARYVPSDPDRASAKGGSKYVNATISSIVTDQLTRAKNKANSPVGFITIGSIASMGQKVTLWSTMQPCLSFVSALIDSSREGSGRKTRIQVKRTGVGTYSVVVSEDFTVRDNLRLRYGELVNGYRVILFGDAWASVTHGIGRTREGTQVMYQSASAPGIDPRIWGNIERAIIVDNVSDTLDLTRRLKQEAIKSGKLGTSLAIAIRTGLLKPLDGYNITDEIPVAINHGVINTANFGSGYYNIWAVAWEAGDDASQTVVLTLLPREDATAPDEDIIDSPTEISTQAEWEISWTPPVAGSTAKYWLDQTTGIVYVRDNADPQSGLGGSA